MSSATFPQLDEKFERAVRSSLLPPEGTTLLYSGGIDSTLVGDVARSISPVRLLTVGVEGSTDVRDAESGATWLGLPWRSVRVGVAEVREALASHELSRQPEPARSVLVSLAVAFGACETPRILVGQGADELFGGYAHFRGLDDARRERRRQADWVRLRDVDWGATLAIAGSLRRDVRAPFLDPEFVAEALRLPVLSGVGAEPTKPILRKWASERGIPSWLTERPKRAMQYGSGIARLVRHVTSG
jgi:asparagine synthase (glutamine-hydrolysing)